MSHDPSGNLAVGYDRRGDVDEGTRPSHDSTQGLLRSAARPLEPRVGTSTVPEPHTARMEYDRAPEDALPPRHPSRQMMRWGPPPSDYGMDDREERRPWGRASYDYGRPSRGMPVPEDYYAEDPYYNRPYRRTPSVREAPSSARGPPRPPRRPRRAPTWEEPSEDESEDDVPVRKRKTQNREDSPPPSEVLRIPFTMWMNLSLIHI